MHVDIDELKIRFDIQEADRIALPGQEFAIAFDNRVDNRPGTNRTAVQAKVNIGFGTHG